MELRCSAGKGEASNVFRFGGGDLISCEIVTARLLETADGIQREEFFNFDIQYAEKLVGRCHVCNTCLKKCLKENVL